MRKENMTAGHQKDQGESALSLEEAFQEIEEIIGNLEREDITLEDSFQEYHRGMLLVKECSESIDRVEKKVLQINEEGELDEF